MVHPVSSWDHGKAAHPRAASGAMPPSPSPDAGMPMGVPVLRRRVTGGPDLRPGRKAPSRQCQRAQDLPPCLDQGEIGLGGRWNDDRPAWMGQTPQQHIDRALSAEFVEDGVDPVRRGIDLLQDVAPGAIVRRGRAAPGAGSPAPTTEPLPRHRRSPVWPGPVGHR